MRITRFFLIVLSIIILPFTSAFAGGHYSGPDLSGQKITISGPWLAPQDDQFRKVIKAFTDATGAVVEYGGSDSFEQQITIDVKAGSPPNLAIFPQPGLAANIAAIGGLTPLGADTQKWVLDNYAAGQSWIDLGTYPDKSGKDQFYGFFYRVNVKSLVWYSPDNFEDNGYEVPNTMEELIALTEKMAKDGNTPWCIGLGSGDATGWPGTDWMEDIMLRTHAPSVYDAWVTNEMPFNDPKVIEAMDFFGSFARNDAYVDGGAAAVATTDFRDSPKGLFTSPPKCMMHRQASFIPAFFPEGVKAGEDYDFFYFPAYSTKKLGNPVLGGGTLFAITNDSPATREFINYLKHPQSNHIWMEIEGSGFLNPHKGIDLAKHSSDTFRGLNQILLNATTFRFDGSDLMPGPIGAGSFWTGMVDYTGGKSAKDVTAEIQKSWDAIK
jgi:alpha-glucoside transport system substrate-binding protein|tara:strand:- start:597 stop:1910 length:1314 start_codon:yes stop_codon:yes gene_type:complete